MKAFAITKERSVQAIDIEEPVPGPNEVLLEVHYIGLCGSDLKCLSRTNAIGNFASDSRS